jgi:hypothetical protein
MPAAVQDPPRVYAAAAAPAADALLAQCSKLQRPVPQQVGITRKKPQLHILQCPDSCCFAYRELMAIFQPQQLKVIILLQCRQMVLLLLLLLLS